MARCLATVPLVKCTICLDDIKDGRRLACEHSFCRTCLEDYQRSNCHGARLPCPLCRHATELDERHVEGLPMLDVSTGSRPTKQSNTSLDYDGQDEADDFGLDKLFEFAPACTMCLDAAVKETGRSDARAISFCKDCDEYMCEICLSGHKRLSKVFSGHTLLSIADALSDSSPRGADTCSEHKTETRSFFCEDCKAIVCQKCIFARHNIRQHSIRERADVELETRKSIDALLMRGNEKKEDIQRCIKTIEEQRRDIKGVISKVFQEITEAHMTAVECLEERKTILIEDVRRVEHACDEKINEMKKHARCKSVRLTRSCETLERGRYGGLEGEGLQSHIRLCEETETQLLENHDIECTKRNLARMHRSAEVLRFIRVNERIIIGHVETIAPEVEQPLQINKLVSLGIEDSVDAKQLHSEDGDLVSLSEDKDKCEDLPTLTRMNDIPVTKMVRHQPAFWSRPSWTLVKLGKFSYSGPTCMAVRTPESVVVGHWDHPATEISLGVKSNTDFLPHYSARATCISFLQNGGIVMLHRNDRIVMYNSEGIPTGVTFVIPGTPWHLDTDENDDIFILTRSGRISVFSATGGHSIRSISTRASPLDLQVGNRCCVVELETEVVVVSAYDGSDIWRLKKADRRELHMMAVDKERHVLYAASSKRAAEGIHVCLLSFNLYNGSQLGSCVLNVASGPLVSMKMMSSDVIALCTSHAVFIFKKDG